MSIELLPSLDELVTGLLGTPWTKEHDCWWLVRTLYREGLGIDLAHEMEQAAFRCLEIWWRGDTALIETIVQPYDLLILATGGPMADHVGVICDTRSFVHSREKTGVCKELIQRWCKRHLQVVRIWSRALPHCGSS